MNVIYLVSKKKKKKKFKYIDDTVKKLNDTHAHVF